MFLMIRMDGQSANLCDAFRVDLERTAADDFALDCGHEERGYAGQIALDELFGEKAHQGSDGGHVLPAGWADLKTHVHSF